MNLRKLIQRFSASLVLGAEAIGALIIHESHSLAVTAPIVIGVIFFTVWLLDSLLDSWVKRSKRIADLIGVKPGSKVKIHGYWYSAIRDHNKTLLGGSVFYIRAGIDDVKFDGVYKDLTDPKHEWTAWSGEGAPSGEDAIVYRYKGQESDEEDEGFGMYSFPRGDEPEQVRGSFYGKNLPAEERYRTAHGERVPKSDLTKEFLKQPEARKAALERYLQRQPATG
jgi:hypothetical protein